MKLFLELSNLASIKVLLGFKLGNLEVKALDLSFRCYEPCDGLVGLSELGVEFMFNEIHELFLLLQFIFGKSELILEGLDNKVKLAIFLL